MSSVNDVNSIPTEGKNLIIVANVKDILHFRAFTADGKRVVDSDESQLPDKAPQIAELKSLLRDWWGGPKLLPSDKERVINAVTLIVGHTLPQVSACLDEMLFDSELVPSDKERVIRDHVLLLRHRARVLAPGTSRVLDVWVHLEGQREEVRRRARMYRGDRTTRFRSGGPIGVQRGSMMRMRLEIPDFGIAGSEDEVLWDGSIGMVSFGVPTPRDAAPGPHTGLVRVLVDGLQVGRLFFEVEVGERECEADEVMTCADVIRMAFASYATEDRDEVLARVQGMLKILPDLDVFLDVLRLRSGEDWERRIEDEITSWDVFFLFWSLAASRSFWVEKEWRMAMVSRGVDFIDPVPLVPASVAPPPIELSRLHFNDWTLALQSRRSSEPG